MIYLADTTYIIDLVQGDRGAEKLAMIIDDENSRVSIVGVTVQEYLRGIYYLLRAKSWMRSSTWVRPI